MMCDDIQSPATEDFIEVTMPTGNPWMKGPSVLVSRADATRIADVAAETAESFRGKFKVSYHYDSPVFKSVSELMPKDENAREPMYRAVASILENRADYSDWCDGNYAASRCFKSRNAYATPGFIEAKRYSEMRGTQFPSANSQSLW